MENFILRSKNNPKIKEFKKLKDKKYRDLTSKFLVEGFHLVNEALKANLVVEILEEEHWNVYENATKVDQSIIELLAFTKTPQKVVAVCKKPTNNSVSNRVVVLNDLQDPGNIGTIIRTAKAFGFDTVIIENIDPFNDKIIRSSQGAIFETNIIETNSAYNTLLELKNQGFRIYETLLSTKAQKLKEVDFSAKKLAIVLGNEGNGISSEIQTLSDVDVYIPIEFESLNVASACAIVLNEIYNNRG
ncbi:TrmH family RNA methyltransferase [Mycoplasma corogypsi]|uniref:TrmH family RNA methyltransferase n=1 Tax=Mycoplasma corogypsi TaxID=2106 RepID=UPI0038734730